MADQKISALPQASILGSDEIAVVESGVSKKLTLAQLKNFAVPITVDALNADVSNSTATAAKITNLDKVCDVGTWVFQYFIRYRSTATGTGVKFSVNHTGTLTSFVANMRYGSTGGAAATAVATQVGNTATGNIHESFTRRAKSNAANMGPTTGVDSVNADMLVIIEGLMVVTVTGDIELWHASEGAVQTTVMADTALILTQVA